MALFIPIPKSITDFLDSIHLPIFSKETEDRNQKGYYGYPICIAYYLTLLIASSLCSFMLATAFLMILISDPNPLVFSLATTLFSKDNNTMITTGIHFYWLLSFFSLFETVISFKFNKEITVSHIIDKIGLIIVTDLLTHNTKFAYLIIPILSNTIFYMLLSASFLSHYLIDRICKHESILQWQLKINLGTAIYISLLFGGAGWYMLIYRAILYMLASDSGKNKNKVLRKGEDNGMTEVEKQI